LKAKKGSLLSPEEICKEGKNHQICSSVALNIGFPYFYPVAFSSTHMANYSEFIAIGKLKTRII
jgi:hypothetical protein